jgi:predicted DCC family thiol-disulfide oxidoreductase YuxK
MRLINDKYLSAEEALNDAYTKEGILIAPTNPYQEIIKGTNPAELTKQEKLAGGIMLRALALYGLGLAQARVIDAEYTRPWDYSLAARKQSCIESLATIYIRDKPVDKWLVVDTLKHLMGWNMDHNFEWWADHLGKSKSTIHRQTMASNRESVRDFYCYWNERAMDNIRIRFTREGVIC